MKDEPRTRGCISLSCEACQEGKNSACIRGFRKSKENQSQKLDRVHIQMKTNVFIPILEGQIQARRAYESQLRHTVLAFYECCSCLLTPCNPYIQVNTAEMTSYLFLYFCVYHISFHWLILKCYPIRLSFIYSAYSIS